MPIGLAFALPVALFMAACAAIDFRIRRIPNWLTVTAALLGLLFSSMHPEGIGPLRSLAGFATGFALLMLPWLLGGGGMGDVKMLAALGAWLGPIGILVAFGLGSVLAVIGMMAVLSYAVVSEGFSSTRRRYVLAGQATAPATTPPRAHRVLPFAVPMALSTWLLLGWLLLKAVN